MDRTLKRREVALLLGVLIALISTAWISNAQTELADKVIRLHVIANSDSTADQTLKLAVRDEVLAQVSSLYPADVSLAEATYAMEQNLSAINAAGQAVVTQEGFSYPVTTSLTECWFPTKDYEGFSLPAGEYTALRVVVGEGAGENWWCVAFPPLCVGAASQTIDVATEAGFFSAEDAALVTGETDGYVLKFKAMELLGSFKEWISED